MRFFCFLLAIQNCARFIRNCRTTKGFFNKNEKKNTLERVILLNFTYLFRRYTYLFVYIYTRYVRFVTEMGERKRLIEFSSFTSETSVYLCTILFITFYGRACRRYALYNLRPRLAIISISRAEHEPFANIDSGGVSNVFAGYSNRTKVPTRRIPSSSRRIVID